MALRPYHLAWLSIHPERTAEWLSARLADGFDIHHMDGDHLNDEPENLALVESGDHLRVHNRGGFRRILAEAKERVDEERAGRRARWGLWAYRKRERGFSWGELDWVVKAGAGLRCRAAAEQMAWLAAQALDLPWPLRPPRERLHERGMKLRAARQELATMGFRWHEARIPFEWAEAQMLEMVDEFLAHRNYRVMAGEG